MSQPGLRERNRMRRREAIVTAAMRLFADRGYDETTIADIAETAEVAPRTVLTYFATKEDIAMAPIDALAERMTTALRSRADGETTIDTLAGWLRGEIEPATSDALDHDLVGGAFAQNPRLKALAMARVSDVVVAYTEAVADDAGLAMDDPGTGVIVAAAAGIVSHVLELPVHSDRTGALDAAVAFLDGGLARLRRGPARP